MSIRDDYPAMTTLADACAERVDEACPEAVRAWRELARLRQWRDDALNELSEWDTVHAEVAGASAHLGRTKAENVRREMHRLRGQCEVWKNGVADVVEPWGYDREAACGRASTSLGQKQELMTMTADHLLHVAPEAGWHGLTLSCLPTGEHYCLTERKCTCTCEMCQADDHWGCDQQEHDYSLDGAPPCKTEFVPDTCWVHHIDAPLEECLVGQFPQDGAPWPVTVEYQGDGEVEIRYAPPSEAEHFDQEGR